MSNFAEVMSTNPPRLVVMFRRGVGGEEQFQWGVVSSIPILSLIGAIIEVQTDLSRGEWIPECDSDPPGDHPPSLVIAWDAVEGEFLQFVNRDIPRRPLVGMLETIKAMLVDSRLAQNAAAQQTRILGVDGQPMRG